MAIFSLKKISWSWQFVLPKLCQTIAPWHYVNKYCKYLLPVRTPFYEHIIGNFAIEKNCEKVCISSRSGIANLAVLGANSKNKNTKSFNLTNFNYVHGYFSIKCVWKHLKATFSDIYWEKYGQSENLKYQRKFENVNEKLEFWFLPEKCYQ